MATFPGIPQVAVFDTAFFLDLPAAAATYAIDRTVAAEHQIRRYGFHGTSHQYVSQVVPRVLGRELADLNQIVLHLGQRGVGVGGARWGGGGDVDGADPARGPGDGHPQRRRRSRRGVPPACATPG